MHKPGQINIADYSYELPNHRIAEYPLHNRDESKLLISRPGVDIQQDTFSNLPNYLGEGSLLVFNDTKVVQARLKFQKATGARVEIFCLEPESPVKVVDQAFDQHSAVVWKCFIGNAKKWKSGLLEMETANGKLFAEKLEMMGNAWLVRFSWTPEHLSWAEVLQDAGRVPLPPYIKREDEPDDRERYQTVFARRDGSVAAPTAGLHFTPNVFKKLNHRSISQSYLTLHVGAGTFKPVSADTLQQHEMHQEQVIVNKSTIIELLKTTKNKTIAVGTTSVRTLESLYWYASALADNPTAEFNVSQWQPYDSPATLSRKEALELLLRKMEDENLDVLQGNTRLMIAPSYSYQMIGAMITNVHQPQSTLLLLVAAFIGDRWKLAYNYAMENDFRFLSYGDSCLFFPE
jgi:S-adenosylmethionine:tRNA ribosyltransferase-isomerase